MNFQEVVEQHIGLAARKQLALADFLGDHSWQLDLDSGTVDFGKSGLFSKHRVFPVQAIGTESEHSDTWMWAWANTRSEIPGPVLRASKELRAFGESHGVDELVAPQLPSAEFPGHLLASVACGICAADCYYRGPYDGGAVYFLIFETPLKSAPAASIFQISKVLSNVISQYEIRSHRNMVDYYLRAEGLRLATTPAGPLVAVAPDGGSLSISFDEYGRLAEIETSTHPDT